jgi:hypothetical protein
MSNKLIFNRRFSSGESCNVEIWRAARGAARLNIGTQNSRNELEQWFTKDGQPEPDISDYLANRADELPEHQDAFHEYRDWFVSVILPTAAQTWNVPITVHVIGWRPHQQEISDCDPGQKPIQRPITADPETGALKPYGDSDNQRPENRNS